MNVPLVVNLREDPFERAPFESDMYRRWAGDKLWTLVPAQAIASPRCTRIGEEMGSDPERSR
jgi:hypothetical protein